MMPCQSVLSEQIDENDLCVETLLSNWILKNEGISRIKGKDCELFRKWKGT